MLQLTDKLNIGLKVPISVEILLTFIKQ